MSGVAAGTLLTFVLTPGFYLTKAMVGGPRDITLSMLIADQVDRLNWGYASTLSAVLRAMALVILAVAPPAPLSATPLDEPAMNLSRHLAGGVVAFLLGDLPQIPAGISTLTILLTAALMGCAHLLRKRSPT